MKVMQTENRLEFTHLIRFRNLDEHVLSVGVLVFIWVPLEKVKHVI